MMLSILIPVYNEKDTILKILKKVDKVNINSIKKEIILVDDGSTDGTRQLLVPLKNRYNIIFHEKNLGKGAAIRTALKHANGDILIIQDADLEYNPEDFKQLIQPILAGETKVVYGSRFLNRERADFKSLHSHYIGNKILTAISNILFGCALTDIETCYKMFTRDVIHDIHLEAKGFELEPEITAKILKRGFKIKELPISYAYRDFTKGKKIRKIDGFKAMYYLLKYRLKRD